MNSIAVIMPVRNEIRHLPTVLSDLNAQDFLEPFDVVVADGMSDDGTRDLLVDLVARQPFRFNLRMVDNSRRHIADGLNLAVDNCAGVDLIVRIDGHSRLPADYLNVIAQALQSGMADVVGPRVMQVPGADTAVARLISACLSSPLGSGGTPSRGGLVAPKRVAHAVMSCYRRVVWERIGGYDTSLLSNEDFDFDWRANASGYRVYALPQPVFRLVARSTIAALVRQRWRYGFWKAAVACRHPASIHLRQFIPLVALVALPILLCFPVVFFNALAAYLVLSWGAILLARSVAWRDRVLALVLAPVIFAVIQGVWAAGLLGGLIANRAGGRSAG